jgi:hypothetical protein
MMLDDDAVLEVFDRAVRPLRAEAREDLHAAAARSLPRPVPVRQTDPALTVHPLDERGRRGFTSVLAAVAVCAALVAGLAFLLRDRPPTPNDGDAAPAAPVDFGDFVWPAPPRDFQSVDDLIAAFADEVLEWEGFAIDGEITGTQEPQAFTLRSADLDASVFAIAVPSPQGGWGFVQIGEGPTSLTAAENGGSTLEYSLGPGVESVDVLARLVDGTERALQAGNGRSVLLAGVAAREVLSVLVVGSNGDGLVIAVVGGQYSAQDVVPPTTPAAPTGRPSGAISDPRNMNFSPWLEGAPPWPPEQPNQYLVFDVAALEGWTQLDSIGGHPIGSGDGYAWSSNVSDPSGTEFQVAVTSGLEDRASVASGQRVDINGVEGVADEGQVSWPLDDTHTALVIEFGTTEVERVVALARQLTTTVVPSISTQQPAGMITDATPDPAAQFAGVVDGVAWSTSVASDGMTTIVEGIAREFRGGGYFPEYGVEVAQWGNNDHCVFVGAYMPAGMYRPRLVLSDETTIDLPVVSVDAASDAFVGCVPYALDARRIDLVDQSGTVAGRAELAAPYLRPSSGMTTIQAALDSVR